MFAVYNLKHISVRWLGDTDRSFSLSQVFGGGGGNPSTIDLGAGLVGFEGTVATTSFFDRTRAGTLVGLRFRYTCGELIFLACLDWLCLVACQ